MVLKARSMKPSKRQNSGLTTRSFWRACVVLGFVVLSIWGGLAAFYLQSYQTAKDAAVEHARHSNDLATVAVETLYKQQMELVLRDAQHPFLVYAAQQLLTVPVDPDSLNSAEMQTRMRNGMGMLVGAGDFEGYFIINRDGMSLASSRENNTGTRNLLADVPGFLDKIWAGETVLSPLLKTDVPLGADLDGNCTKRLNFFVGAPIIERQSGRVLAAFTIRLNPAASLFPLLIAHSFSDTSETYLVDKDGKLVSPSRFAETVGLVGPCAANDNYLNKRLLDPNASTEKFTKAVTGTLAKQSGYSDIPYADYRGVPVIGAWSYSDLTGLGIISETDAAEAFEDLNDLKTLLPIIGLFSAGLLGLVGGIIRREIKIDEERATVGWLTELMQRGVFFLDAEGRFARVSKTFCNQFGVMPRDLIGKDLSIIDPQLADAVRQALRGKNKGSDGFEIAGNVDYTTADGQHIVYRIELSSASQNGGGMLGGICTDLTELDMQRRSLEKAKSETEATLRARNQFLSMTSHELRTPLNAIVGAISILDEIYTGEEDKKLIGFARGGADDLLRITEALHEYITLTSQISVRDPAPFGLQDALQDAVAEAKKTKKTALEVPISIDPDVPETIMSDQEAVKGITSELVSNALAHGVVAEKKEPSVALTVRKGRLDGMDCIDIAVQDDGPGLDAEEVADAFEIFSRAKKDNTSRTRGVGIGLPLSSERAKLIGGEVVYQPNPEGGSIFVLKIPLGDIAA